MADISGGSIGDSIIESIDGIGTLVGYVIGHARADIRRDIIGHVRAGIILDIKGDIRGSDEN